MTASILTGTKALTVEQVPLPSPGDDEVLVKIAAVGVCGSDTDYYRHGRIGGFVVGGPLILGHECSGTIVAVGVDIPGSGSGSGSRSSRSASSAAPPCRAGRYHLRPRHGFYAIPPIDDPAFAEYATIRTEFAHPVPERSPTRPPLCWSRCRSPSPPCARRASRPDPSILIAPAPSRSSSAPRPRRPAAPRTSSSPTSSPSTANGRCATAPPGSSTPREVDITTADCE